MSEPTPRPTRFPRLEARIAIFVALVALVVSFLLLVRACGVEDASGATPLDSSYAGDSGSDLSDISVCTPGETGATGE